MAFQTDQQTMADLSLLATEGATSIFQIFNRTRTRGGTAMLREMFLSPLSDVEKINGRSATIEYLSQLGIRFPISVDQFDPVESYLKITDKRTKLSAREVTITSRINNLVAPDAETALIHNGITALIKLLKELDGFVRGLDVVSGHPLSSQQSQMMAILSTAGFEDILKSPVEKKYTHQEFIAFDDFFRFGYRNQVMLILDFVYQLDAYFAIGTVAREENFVFPKALPSDEQILDVEGVFHPLIEHAVGNSIQMTKERNVIFLTGANMAGKSTLMKSLTTALFLAHMGFPVPAKAMKFSVREGIYTTINLPDNLGMGASHFYAEVLRVKKIALELKLGKNLFVLFDEMFRGTNVKDACEATIACTQAFGLKRNSLFVISTHIIEAGEVLMKKCKNINFIYLPTTMEGNKPKYSYKIEYGLTADRHGMVIVMNEGILEILESGLRQINKSTT